jgi:hypothetical protein
MVSWRRRLVSEPALGRVKCFPKRFPCVSFFAQRIGARSSMVVPHRPPPARQSSVTESVVLPPGPRVSIMPKSKSSPSNAGSAKWQTKRPAHRAKSSACTNFPAAPGSLRRPGEFRFAFDRRSNGIRGSPRLDPGLIPHLKIGVSSQIDQVAS